MWLPGFLLSLRLLQRVDHRLDWTPPTAFPPVRLALGPRSNDTDPTIIRSISLAAFSSPLATDPKTIRNLDPHIPKGTRAEERSENTPNVFCNSERSSGYSGCFSLAR